MYIIVGNVAVCGHEGCFVWDSSDDTIEYIRQADMDKAYEQGLDISPVVPAVKSKGIPDFLYVINKVNWVADEYSCKQCISGHLVYKYDLPDEHVSKLLSKYGLDRFVNLRSARAEYVMTEYGGYNAIALNNFNQSGILFDLPLGISVKKPIDIRYRYASNCKFSYENYYSDEQKSVTLASSNGFMFPCMYTRDEKYMITPQTYVGATADGVPFSKVWLDMRKRGTFVFFK